jgi:hypothetical protein
MIIQGNAPYSTTLKKLYEGISQDWQEQKKSFAIKDHIDFEKISTMPFLHN